MKINVGVKLTKYCDQHLLKACFLVLSTYFTSNIKIGNGQGTRAVAVPTLLYSTLYFTNYIMVQLKFLSHLEILNVLATD